MSLEEQYVKKSVFTVHSSPVRGRLSVVQRKLVLALAHLAGEQYRRLEQAEREALEQALRAFVAAHQGERRSRAPAQWSAPRFFATYGELARLTGYAPESARMLWPQLVALQSVQLRYNLLGHEAASAEAGLFATRTDVVCAPVCLVHRARRGMVSWSYDPLVMAAMVHPRTFARLSLRVVSQVRTYAALALYENVRRFVAIGRAGPYPVLTWQRLLSADGQVADWARSGNEFRRRIRRAIQELQQIPGCDVALALNETHLRGEPAASFEVRSLAPASPGCAAPGAATQLPGDAPSAVSPRLTALGFSAGEAARLLGAHGEALVRAKLALLERQPAVRSPRGWLISALVNDFVDPLETLAVRERERAAQARAAACAEHANEALAQQRQRSLRARYAGLDETSRLALAARFEQSELGRGVQGARLLSGRTVVYESMFFVWLAQQPEWQVDAPTPHASTAYAESAYDL